MSWKHLRVWSGVELRRLVPPVAGFVGLGAVLLVWLLAHRHHQVALTGGWITLDSVTFVLSGGLLLALMFGGALIADHQAKELAGGTRRHLAALGLRPGELLLSKTFAAILGLAVCDGALIVVAVASGISNTGLGGITRLGELNLLALVLWAFQLANVSYPRIGGRIMVAALVVYVVGLAYLPWLGQHGNMFQLVIALMPAKLPVDLAGATVAALVSFALGLTVTWAGQRFRVVE